ncbi:F17F8.17 [Arabidopsis thaliana]|uniref:Putative F-box protein At1g30945 n=1 Tax=Arabidopsis thaliana TaxID=3702 RepID=FB23_ARATH|nr:RecName: Full=Putative F-box protein At1g30945 [Arabidopsis thaliana]AAF98188.1 F17F8.17 [Arabidopsis thaliana]
MDSGKTFDSISNDLFLEILLRLSTKSIDRSRCVSKQWASILCSQDFTESEKFNFINASSFLFSSTKLINYKGKLGGIDLAYNHGGVYPVELRMWVLEDVEKHEWSRHVYSLPETIEFQQCNYNICVGGMNAIGFEDYLNRRVYAFVDYVEDLSVNDAMQLKSSSLQNG